MTTPSTASTDPQPARTVAAGIAQHNGLILACQRRADSAFPLKWEFPGGKLESNESPRDALARELREELSVEAHIGPEIYRTRHRYPELSFELELLFFSIALDPRDICAIDAATRSASSAISHNFAQIAWLAPSQLPSLDFLPADLELIRLLASGQIQLRE
jgi:8-oxo-dGTP diphosphatase